MGSVIKLCRVTVSNIYSNIYSSTRYRTINVPNISPFLRSSNNIFNVRSSVRWNIIRVANNYSTSAKEPSEQQTVAGQIAQDILASKIKEDAQKNVAEESEAEEKRKKDEQENAKRALKFSFYSVAVMVIGVGGSLLYRWGSPPVDEEGFPLDDEFSHLPTLMQYMKRTHREFRVMNRIIQEPSREQLLPDPLSGQYIQPPYTLVLELKDVLVHPEWTYQTGWRFKKRPGLEFLLQTCAPPLFEIVIYTKEQGFTAFPVIDKLDPNGFIWYRLFKDSTHYVDGRHMKELNLLNRDLNKVIMVDWDEDAVTCPRNQLRVPRWEGSMQDKGLVQLAMLLRTIAESDVDDVREVLDYYRQFPDPLSAYSQLQQEALEQDQLREQEKKIQNENPNKGVTRWSPSFLKKW
uniref:Mitochondrial import inner membrane translocase subunit TIM50 n=2 Tax=Hirondellea gigas TaxID=1518452 RepID=A0A6A7FTY4_9CRUS